MAAHSVAEAHFIEGNSRGRSGDGLADAPERPSFRRWLVAPLLLALAACAGTTGKLADDKTGALDRDMLVSGLSDIDSIYINKPELSSLTLAGMQQLSSLDSAIRIEGDDDELKLLHKEQLVDAEFLKDGDDASAKQWGKAAAEILGEARRVSPAITKAGDEKIYETVFTGIVGKLDGFSRYSGADAAKEEKAARDGFGGIGVRISVEDDQVRITSVMHYTPAERLGLKRDDLVLEIDGDTVEGMTQQQVVNLLRGEVDSRVRLLIQREGKDEPFEVNVKRAHVVPETVSYRREGNVAYFRLFGFNSETSSSLKREISDAKDEIGKKLQGVVLDLRGNPGGLVPQSVAVANLFLEEGRIVSIHGRHPDSHQYFEASDGDIAGGRPIAVLIDGNSASAAEIVAAALQDNGRAVVIGTNSYGKGTVQNIKSLPNQGEIKLTWARFHAPSGYTLHHLGVLPTVCTSGAHSVDSLLAELRAGNLPQVPMVKRNTTKPDDTPALDALRRTCPSRKVEDPVDLELALKLIELPSLYAGAVGLAQPPAAAHVDDAAEALLPFIP
ncbi:MAG: PDZ domain-containing protein [Rhodospirillaceae bacterium]|nr:PDZ domain-containing protein [Rhodospirillaceae bacterium]